MNFSLQDLVRHTMAEAERREKLAEATSSDAAADGEDQSKKEPGAKNTPPVNPATTPERNEESIEAKTGSVSTAFVQKMASAVEYLNNEFLKQAVGEVMPPPPNTQPQASTEVGAGKGPNVTVTNLEAPTPGVQSTETGQATASNVIPMQPASEPASPGNVNPATSIGTDVNTPPGGGEDWTKKDVFKQAAARGVPVPHLKKVARVFNLMNKMADVPPDATPSGEGVPSLPSEASRQEALIGSNEAARDYTKRDAKAVPKERMGEAIDEPAQVMSTDPVLQNNLSNTTEAGTKISAAKIAESAKTAAAARALLQKIAEEGSAEGASPEEQEKAQKLKALLEAKQKESQGLGSLGAGSMGAGASGDAGALGGGY